MATKPSSKPRLAARPRPGSTPNSTRRRGPVREARRSRPLKALPSPRSDNLVGGIVRFSPDIPVSFGETLTSNHLTVGRWVAAHGLASEAAISREEARRLIENTLTAKIHEIIRGLEILGLHVAVLSCEESPDDVDQPPAILISHNSHGDIFFKWIEDEAIPVGWRAAAYHAIATTLPRIVPLLALGDMMEELSMWYWDGEIDDEGAKLALIHNHGADEDELDGYVLPSQVEAKVPGWMKSELAARSRCLPPALRRSIIGLKQAARKARGHTGEGGAWSYDRDQLLEYAPWLEDASCVPPVTIVPSNIFEQELDDVYRFGMENGSDDTCGIMAISSAAEVDTWLTSFAAGVAVLKAAEALISLDPSSFDLSGTPA